MKIDIRRGEKMEFNGEKIITLQTIIPNISDNFTYEFWVKPAATHEIDIESISGVKGVSDKRYAIGAAHAGHKNFAGVGVSVGTNGISVYEHTINHLPPTLVYPTTINDWTHIAIVYKDKIPFLYINGDLKKMGLRSKKAHLFPSGIIGGLEYYGYFVGEIEDIRLWKHSRTAEQIKENMFKKLTGKEDGIFKYWDLGNFNKINKTHLNDANNQPKEFFEKVRLKQDNTAKIKNLRVLFVTSDLNVDNPNLPYDPIENSIISSLEKIVLKLKVVTTRQDILKEANEIEADCVIVFNGFKMSVDKVKRLNEEGIKTAIWMTDDPYYLDIASNIAKYYHFVFTQDINCVSFYKSVGCSNVFHLPLAADPTIFYPKSVDSKYKSDILFIGSAFANRVRFFDTISHYLLNKDFFIIGPWWERLKDYPLLEHKIFTNIWLSPEETANYYNGSKIVINLHRQHDDLEINKNSKKIKGLSVNPRTFEISACGSFQLTDVREDLYTYYTPGYDISTYTTPNELINKIEYYLNHEYERKEMSLRALRKTHENHNYINRVWKMLGNILS